VWYEAPTNRQQRCMPGMKSYAGVGSGMGSHGGQRMKKEVELSAFDQHERRPLLWPDE